MYKIYIDGELAYYPEDDELIILEPELELELNDAGAFEFSLPDSSPFYDRIQNRVTMVQVIKDEKEIFYGEVRDYGKDSYNTKRVYCVGELAFLFDSIQRPAKYQNYTPRQMLEAFLNVHNAYVEDRKKFNVGIVTVRDPNNSLYRFTNNETTLEAIRKKLVETLGGFLRVRKVGTTRYLDWINLSEYGRICQQPIQFGVNMLDYSENTTSDDLYTAIIPYGARLKESKIEGLETYLDITSVNDGKDYIYLPEAVERYGWITAVEHWDDVTKPDNLKRRGEEWLTDNQYENMVLELSAVDLSILYSQFYSFELGDSVHALAEPYGMDRFFPVQKLKIYITEPDKNTVTLGNVIQKSFIQQSHDTNRDVNSEIQKVHQTNSVLQSAINNATQMLTGTKGGYRLDEFDNDGLFLRTLYMDAPNKNDAKNIVQIGPQGFGFSNSGYKGPYKNAWTIGGVLNAEFIAAGKLVGIEVDVSGRIRTTSTTSNIERVAILASAELDYLYDGNVVGKIGPGNQYYYYDSVGQGRCVGIEGDEIRIGPIGSLYQAPKNGDHALDIDNAHVYKSRLNYPCLTGDIHLRPPVKDLGWIKQANLIFNNIGDVIPVLSCNKNNNSVTFKDVSFHIDGSLHVSGTKSREVTTKHYGNVELNAYETCSPLFADYGSGITDEYGISYIFMEEKFIETVDINHSYQVFIGVFQEGDVRCIQKERTYFIVKGTPHTKFDWNAVYAQRDYSEIRLEQEHEEAKEINDIIGIDFPQWTETAPYLEESTGYLKEYGESELRYDELAFGYLENYEREVNAL